MKYRSQEPEMMDNPNLEIEELKMVFQDINRVNWVLMGNQLTKKHLWRTISKKPEKTYTIYDFGCGDGQLLRELSRFLRKKGIQFSMFGIDISDKALAIATENSSDHPEINYIKLDVLNNENTIAPCDILLCNLTLHHFQDEHIPTILNRFIQFTRQEIVINDLKRSAMAAFGFKIISTLFLKTAIAKNDGLVSVKSGFKKADLNQFKAILPNMVHHTRWFPNFRFIWSIKKVEPN